MSEEEGETVNYSSEARRRGKDQAHGEVRRKGLRRTRGKNLQELSCETTGRNQRPHRRHAH